MGRTVDTAMRGVLQHLVAIATDDLADISTLDGGLVGPTDAQVLVERNQRERAGKPHQHRLAVALDVTETALRAMQGRHIERADERPNELARDIAQWLIGKIDQSSSFEIAPLLQSHHLAAKTAIELLCERLFETRLAEHLFDVHAHQVLVGIAAHQLSVGVVEHLIAVVSADQTNGPGELSNDGADRVARICGHLGNAFVAGLGQRQISALAPTLALSGHLVEGPAELVGELFELASLVVVCRYAPVGKRGPKHAQRACRAVDRGGVDGFVTTVNRQRTAIGTDLGAQIGLFFCGRVAGAGGQLAASNHALESLEATGQPALDLPARLALLVEQHDPALVKSLVSAKAVADRAQKLCLIGSMCLLGDQLARLVDRFATPIQ
jgi:hypothetical protein